MSERAPECPHAAQRGDTDLRSFSTFAAGNKHRSRRSGSGSGSGRLTMSDRRDSDKRQAGVVLLSSSPLPVPALSSGSPSPSISSIDTAASGVGFGGHGHGDGSEDEDEDRDDDFYILEGEGRAPLITTAAGGAEPSAPSRVSLSSWGTAEPSVSSASPSLSAPSIEPRSGERMSAVTSGHTLRHRRRDVHFVRVQSSSMGSRSLYHRPFWRTASLCAARISFRRVLDLDLGLVNPRPGIECSTTLLLSITGLARH
jgi:hypothetical protein